MTGPPEIVLDLSRLVSRINHPTPTGVDRVEMAYARELLRRCPERLSFSAVHPLGGYGRLDRRSALRFLDHTARRWSGGRTRRSGRTEDWRRLATSLWSLRPRAVPAADRPRLLIQSSPHHLHREDLTRRILRRERAKLVCLLHDLIPLEFPEYARPGGAALHLRRIATVARTASAVVTNSQATLRSFLPYLEQAGRAVPVAAASLGLDESSSYADEPSPYDRPFFICIGTIEPRKNHLLLLHLWRRIAEAEGPRSAPILVIVGRRGWENEQVVDLLERCPALVGCVEERGRLSDQAMRALLRHARALLLPSFAEGYGMPVPEALAAGLPVLCSDLPALREAGGKAPEYLDPLDGAAWLEAIRAYADPRSPRRDAQVRRLRDWTPPTWEAHIDTVLKLSDEVMR